MTKAQAAVANAPDAAARARAQGDVEALNRELGRSAPASSDTPPPVRVEVPLNLDTAGSDPELSIRDTILKAAETLGTPFAKFGEYGANAIKHPIDSAYDLGVGLVHGGAHMATALDKAANKAGLYRTPPQSTEAIDRAYAKAGPVAGVGNVIPSGVALGPAGRLGVLPDVGANAGYSALEAYGEGQDPAKAAMWGGGGAAVGRYLGRTLGSSAEPRGDVKTLLDAGITPTPGQAGGRVAQTVEQVASDFIPGVGASVDAAKNRAIRQASQYEVKRAIAPISQPRPGQKVGVEITEPAGRKAVQQANDLIEQSYQSLVPKTFMTPDGARTAAQRAGAELDNMPGLTDRQRNFLYSYVEQKLGPMVRNRGNIDGATAKALDAELAAQARRYGQSANAGDHALGDAFYTVREHLRGALQGTDNLAVAQLRATDQAYKNMIPVNKAATAAIRKKGVYDPVQFSQKGGSGEVNEAALNLLDKPSGGLDTLARRGGGFGVTSFLGGNPLVGAAAYGGGRLVSAALYSEPVVKGIIASMNLMPNVRTWVNGLPPDRQREFVQRMLETMAAPTGRSIATQEAQ
jgi:hypothetical protein